MTIPVRLPNSIAPIIPISLYQPYSLIAIRIEPIVKQTKARTKAVMNMVRNKTNVNKDIRLLFGFELFWVNVHAFGELLSFDHLAISKLHVVAFLYAYNFTAI
jgi:hypothetical protein